MAESTLTQTYNQLQAEAGFFLGWGRGPNFGDPAWDTRQQQTLTFILQSGLRRFYWPSPPYDWSFLQPISQIDCPAGSQHITLPDDWGGVNGSITIQSTTTQLTWTLRITHEEALRQMYQITPTATGRPVSVALQPLKGTGPASSNRMSLFIYPITDQDYVFQIPYTINPDFLTGALPYAYGGAQHAETLRCAILAAAEDTLDDSPSTWRDRLAQQIQTSIQVDRKNKPQFVGYNRDRSDERYRWRRSDWHGWGSISVNGVVPGPPS